MLGNYKLFLLSGSVDTFRTDFQILAVDFFRLKIYSHGSFGGDVGMGAALGGFWSAAANLADSAHITYNMQHVTIFFVLHATRSVILLN